MNYCPVCQNKIKLKCNSCENETVLGLNFVKIIIKNQKIKFIEEII